MSCTAAEIAEKKRQAIERLKQKQSTATTSAVQPLQQKENTTTVTSPGSSKSFYGNGSNEKAAKLSEYENKIKHSSHPRTPNRILSQPYSKRHEHNNNSNRNNIPSSSTNRVILSSSAACTCSMINEQRFVVTASAYNTKLIEVFKTIPTRSYGNTSHITYIVYCKINKYQKNNHFDFDFVIRQ